MSKKRHNSRQSICPCNTLSHSTDLATAHQIHTFHTYSWLGCSKHRIIFMAHCVDHCLLDIVSLHGILLPTTRTQAQIQCEGTGTTRITNACSPCCPLWQPITHRILMDGCQWNHRPKLLAMIVWWWLYIPKDELVCLCRWMRNVLLFQCHSFSN